MFPPYYLPLLPPNDDDDDATHAITPSGERFIRNLFLAIIGLGLIAGLLIAVLILLGFFLTR